MMEDVELTDVSVRDSAETKQLRREVPPLRLPEICQGVDKWATTSSSTGRKSLPRRSAEYLTIESSKPHKSASGRRCYLGLTSSTSYNDPTPLTAREQSGDLHISPSGKSKDVAADFCEDTCPACFYFDRGDDAGGGLGEEFKPLAHALTKTATFSERLTKSLTHILRSINYRAKNKNPKLTSAPSEVERRVACNRGSISNKRDFDAVNIDSIVKEALDVEIMVERARHGNSIILQDLQSRKDRFDRGDQVPSEAYSWGLFAPDNPVRAKMLTIAESDAFDYFMFCMIILSCMSMTFERPSIPRGSLEERILFYLDVCFTSIFGLEFLIKSIGLTYNAYIQSWANKVNLSLQWTYTLCVLGGSSYSDVLGAGVGVGVAGRDSSPNSTRPPSY